MKNIFQILIVIILTVFSFYYTDKVINFIRDSDPIMKDLKEYNKSNKIDAVNAKVKGNKVIPGVYGKEVDYDKSFKKMKEYGTYNESLTVFKDVEPTISVDDYYNKYIQEGSGINNDVSLVFEVKDKDDITEIINILDKSNTYATFFIDGLWLENNVDTVMNLIEKNHEIEILSYDNKYEELYFSSSLNTINKMTNLKPKYCYAKYDQKEVLELCSKLGLHTIIPTIRTGNYPFNDVKSRLSRGSIISFSIISSTKIELETIINYIRQKGYDINTLDVLLNEALSVK